jgi:hypothetical protein
LISVRPAAGGFSALRRTSVMIGMAFLVRPHQSLGARGLRAPSSLGGALGARDIPTAGDTLAFVTIT